MTVPRPPMIKTAGLSLFAAAGVEDAPPNFTSVAMLAYPVGEGEHTEFPK